MYLQRVKNDSVWQSLKILFLGSMLIFLINILFGFDNTLTAGEIDRWQTLIHLHSGSIGWITLSAIGIAIWLVTGDRDVDSGYESRIRTLVWAAVLIFAGYVVSFGLAFSRPSGFLVTLLPIFGAGSVILLPPANLWSWLGDFALDLSNFCFFPVQAPARRNHRPFPGCRGFADRRHWCDRRDAAGFRACHWGIPTTSTR
jgi:hypothetical protein